MGMTKDRFHKMGPTVAAAEDGRDTEPARANRADCQQHQGYGHNGRRFLEVLLLFLCSPEFTMKDEKEQPKGVKGGHKGDQGADKPAEFSGSDLRVKGHHQDFILAEKSGQSGHARDGERGEQEGPVGNGHVFFQAAHVFDILFVVHAEDDRTAAEKEQGLEKGMGEQVENTGRVGSDPAGDEHVGQLTDGGIGDNPFDIGLDQGNGGGKQTGHCTENGDHVQGKGGEFKERVAAGDQKDTGGDHGGGMDQGADRGRPLHGIGQPDMKRDLGGFTDGAAEQEQGNGSGQIKAHPKQCKGAADNLPGV